MAFDREHSLSNVAQWHYLTGPLPTLKAVWRAYGEQPIIGPDDSVNHASALEFIGPSGRLRALGSHGAGSADATRWATHSPPSPKTSSGSTPSLPPT